MAWIDRLLGLFRKPTLEDVAREVKRQLQGHGATAVEFRPEHAEIVATRGDDSSVVLYLGNLFHDYARAPRRSRPQVVERFVSGMFQEESVPTHYADAKPRLMPVVRRTADLGVYQLSTAASGMADQGRIRPVMKPFVADLSMALVCDMPTSMAYVCEDHVEAWGVSLDAAFADAMDNLRGLPEHGGWSQLVPGVWSGEWGDAYESSRILIPDLVYRLGIAKPVAMVPFRNALLVTDASNSSGIEAMVSVVEGAMEHNNRWLSFQLLRLDGKQWSDGEPPAGAADTFRKLQLNQDATTYKSQKELLERLHESNGTDIFVATFSGIQLEGQPLMSYSVWSEGVDTLLPATDLWALSWQLDDGETGHLLVSRKEALSLLGDLVEETREIPTRYRVKQFPDAETLALLKDQALD